MKSLLPVLTFSILLFASCKKEQREELYGICGTDPNVLEDPNTGNRVATLTQKNVAGEAFTQKFFYNAAGFLDSVVQTGSQNLTQKFVHTPGYTLIRVYDSAGVYTGNNDSISLNAAGYPMQMFNRTYNTVARVSTFTYNTAGQLLSRQHDYEPNRYTYTIYNKWEAGDLVTYDISNGNPAVIYQYTYSQTVPSASGEPQNLYTLLELGRPLKISSHLRISERKNAEPDSTMLLYIWKDSRIQNWTQDEGKTITATLTYYN